MIIFGNFSFPFFWFKVLVVGPEREVGSPPAPVAGQGPPTTGTASVAPSLRELYFLLRQDL